MDSELYLTKVSQRKTNGRPRPPSAPLARKATKAHRRPYSAGRWEKQSKQKYGSLASGSRRTERKYNFFSLNVLGGRQNKQRKKLSTSRRRIVVSQHQNARTKSRDVYKKFSRIKKIHKNIGNFLISRKSSKFLGIFKKSTIFFKFLENRKKFPRKFKILQNSRNSPKILKIF